MAKYEKVIDGHFEDVVDRLHKDIMNSARTMKLVDESSYIMGDTKIEVRVYDKYFMRNGNRASLTLTVAGRGSEIFISAIGAGGGQGIFFNFSLGAEEDMVEVVRNSVQRIK